MREYELFYLVGESKEALLPEIQTEVEKIFTEAGATFLPAETSDKRKLAYPIQGETRGTYIARRFTLPTADDLSREDIKGGVNDPIAQLQRLMALNKNILRTLILRADELPELKPIERTEYMKREGRGRGGRSTSVRIPVLKDTPTPNQDKDAAPVSKETIDKQLEEVLNI